MAKNKRREKMIVASAPSLKENAVLQQLRNDLEAQAARLTDNDEFFAPIEQDRKEAPKPQFKALDANGLGKGNFFDANAAMDFVDEKLKSGSVMYLPTREVIYKV